MTRGRFTSKRTPPPLDICFQEAIEYGFNTEKISVAEPKPVEPKLNYLRPKAGAKIDLINIYSLENAWMKKNLQ